MIEAPTHSRQESGSMHHSQYLSNYHANREQQEFTATRHQHPSVHSHVRVVGTDSRLRSALSPPVVIPRTTTAQPTYTTVYQPEFVHEAQVVLPDGGKVVGERVYRRELTGMRIIDIEEYNLLMYFKFKYTELQTTIESLEQTIEEQKRIIINNSNGRKSVRIEETNTKDIERELETAQSEIVRLRGVIDSKDDELRQRRMRGSEGIDSGSQYGMRKRMGELEFELDTALSQKYELELKLKIMQTEINAAIDSQKMMESDANARVKRGEERIMTLEMRILELEDKLAQAQKEIREGRDRDLNISIHMSNHHNDSVELDMEQLGAMRTLRTKNTDLEGINILLESKLKQREGRDKDQRLQLEQELDELKKQVLERNDKLKQQAAALEEWQTNQESFQSSYEKLKSKHDLLASSLASAQSSLSFTSSELASLQSSNSSLLSQLSAVTASLDTLQSFFDLLQQSKANSDSQIRELTSEVQSLQTKLSQLTQERDKLNERVRTLEEEAVRIKDREREALRREREAEDERERLREELGKDIGVLNDEINKRDQALAEYERERDDMGAKEAELLEMIEDYKLALKNLEEERDLLSKEIEAFETTVNELSEQAANLHQLEDLSHKLLCDNATLSKQVGDLTQELENLRSQQPSTKNDPHLLLDASQQLEWLLQALSLKEQEIKLLHHQLDIAVSEANKRLFDIDHAQIENSRLVNERAHCLNELAKLAQVVQPNHQGGTQHLLTA